MEAGHKKYILENIRKKSVKEIAQKLNLKEKKIRKFLKKRPEAHFESASPQKEPRSSIRKKTIFLSIVSIIAIGFIVYSNSFNGEFLWDDEPLVKENEYIRNWSNIGRLFTESIMAGGGRDINFYRPLQMITYMADYSLWKLDVKGYHLTNILLHISVALAIYWLVNILFKDNMLSLSTAILFAVHPVHTEVVTYISGRSDSLAALFMLLCLISYIKSSPSKTKGVYIGMVLSYAAALLSRESSLILPALVMVYHLSFKTKFKVKEFFSLIGLASVYVALRLTVLQDLLTHVSYQTTLFERLPGFFVAITNYIRLLFLPFNLHMEYGNKLFHWHDPQAIVGIVLLVAFLIYAFRKKGDNKLVFFSLAWFFIALLPVFNLYPVNAYMAEHWLYLPSIGFFIMASKVINSFFRVNTVKSLMIMFVIGGLTFYSYLTMRQNVYWRVPRDFYTRTLKYAPDSSRMHNNLGLIYAADGREVEAAALFKKAIDLSPDYTGAYANLGRLYSDDGKNEEAVSLYKKYLKIRPDHATTYNNLGVAYHASGKSQEAIVSYEKAIEINPDYDRAYSNLGILKYELGKNEEAIALYKKSIQINPDDGETYNNLSVVYVQQKQYKLAIEYCDKAIESGFTNTALLEALKPYR